MALQTALEAEWEEPSDSSPAPASSGSAGGVHIPTRTTAVRKGAGTFVKSTRLRSVFVAVSHETLYSQPWGTPTLPT